MYSRSIRPGKAVSLPLAATTALLLSACGGGSTLVSASAVAKCAHARQQPVSSLTSNASSQRAVIAKVAAGGWLRQDYAAVEQVERKEPAYEIYVFVSTHAATEAFKLISSAPNAKIEWGGGGTFQRKNVIVNTDQGEAGSLTNSAESLLNRCVGTGASQVITRPGDEAVTSGQTLSERTRAEEDGAAPITSNPEPTQEPPASESIPNPGQSPAPKQGE